MKENEHSQNKNHRRAALDRMVEIADESGMYDLPLSANKEHPMKNWEQIKQTAKQTRTEKDQKIVADEQTNQKTQQKHQKWLQTCQQLAQTFSTCTKRQYAAIIINPQGHIIATGYNGSPPGHPHCNQGHCPRQQQNSDPGTNYDNCIANHAETNALLQTTPQNRQGATLYINGTPCYTCAKLIAASGITTLIHHPDPTYKQWPTCQQTLHNSNITTIAYPRTSQMYPQTTP